MTLDESLPADAVLRLLDLATEGLGEVDQTGRWRLINPAGAQLLGSESARLAGLMGEHHHVGGAIDDLCPICQALKTGTPQRGAGVVHWRPDGGEIRLSYAVVPVKEGGAVVRFVDDSKQLPPEPGLRERQARIAETTRYQTDFIAALAHELRNPLAPMRTALEFMKRADDGSVPPMTQLREMMDRQLERLVRLTNDFIELAQVTSDQVALEKAPIAL